MRRRRTELLVLAVVVAGLAVVAAVSLSGGSSAAFTAAPSARPAAGSFAQAYVSYLSGQTEAAAVPGAGPAARTVIAQTARVPAQYRGQVRLTKLAFSGVLGAHRATALLTATAGPHSLQAAMSLTYVSGRWEISSLVPPDVDTVFSSPAPKIQVPAAIQSSARAFALAYADYRTGATAAVPPGLVFIRRQIAAKQDPLAGTAQTGAHARMIQVAALPQGTLTAVDAVAEAAGHRLSFSFNLQLTSGHWQASEFPTSS